MFTGTMFDLKWQFVAEEIIGSFKQILGSPPATCGWSCFFFCRPATARFEHLASLINALMLRPHQRLDQSNCLPLSRRETICVHVNPLIGKSATARCCKHAFFRPLPHYAVTSSLIGANMKIRLCSKKCSMITRHLAVTD